MPGPPCHKAALAAAGRPPRATIGFTRIDKLILASAIRGGVKHSQPEWCCRRLAKVGRFRAAIGPRRPPRWAEVGPMSANFGRNRAKLGRNPAELVFSPPGCHGASRHRVLCHVVRTPAPFAFVPGRRGARNSGTTRRARPRISSTRYHPRREKTRHVSKKRGLRTRRIPYKLVEIWSMSLGIEPNLVEF